MKSVTIVYTTFNRIDYVRKTLPLYREVTKDYPNCRIVVCDDFSTDGTRELLLDWQQNKNYFDDLYLSKANLGVTNSRNQGIQRNPADIYVIMDDDALNKYGFISEIVNIFEKFPQIGALTTFRPLWELFDESYRLSSLDLKLLKEDNIQAMLVKYIGSGMSFPNYVWKKVGAFSHPEKRCSIGRYSDRVKRAKFLTARTYPPFSETMDMPQHPECLRFTKLLKYTQSVAPEAMQQVEFYEKCINECKEFDNTHYINENGDVVSRI